MSASIGLKPLMGDSLKPDVKLDFDEDYTVPKGFHGKTNRKIPRGTLAFEEYHGVCERILAGIRRYGVEFEPDSLPVSFKDHWRLFKTSLDLWEGIPIKKALSKRDIIEGCLSRGPAFAEWLKKARYYSFVDKVSVGGNACPEEYVLPDYKGYDSIFRESELIHWKEETSDVEYSFIPVGPLRDEEGFKETFRSLLKEVLPKCRFRERIDTLSWIKASKGYDPSSGKTFATRDTMRQLHKIGPGWFGRRTLIRPFPGGIRDTAIPDPDTLAKIKLCGSIFKEICEHIPESGMSTKISQNFARILKRKLFTHLDFKKAGLTFPRELFLLLADVLEENGFDVWFLRDISSICLEIEDETYETKRGFCLGWMNEALTVSIIVLLRLMRSTYGLSYDFIVYNDDLVIGDQDRDPETYSELFRFAAKEFFNSFQIFLSEKKIFTSKSVQFLEEYVYQGERYGLDMEKRQIGTSIFAKSLCSQYIWAAKMYCQVAYENYPDKNLLWACMARGRETKDPFEWKRPFNAGGWITPMTYGLDNSLENENDLKYILTMKDVKLPKVSERVQHFDAKKAFDAKHRKSYNASHRLGWCGDDVREFLEEQSDIQLKELYLTRLAEYSGVKKIFRNVLVDRVSKLSTKFWDPP